MHAPEPHAFSLKTYNAPVWLAGMRLGVMLAAVTAAFAVLRAPHSGVFETSRDDRLVVLGASVVIAGPLWGIVFGLVLTRRVRRRYTRATQDSAPNTTVALVSRIVKRRAVPGELRVREGRVAFSPERAADATLATTFALDASVSIRSTRLKDRWLAELLGSPARAIEVATRSDVLRFAMPRPDEWIARFANATPTRAA